MAEAEKLFHQDGGAIRGCNSGGSQAELFASRERMSKSTVWKSLRNEAGITGR
jgi:hypothetical protein